MDYLEKKNKKEIQIKSEQIKNLTEENHKLTSTIKQHENLVKKQENIF